MLISEKYKFIFIHVYKNAGTSIRTALEPYAMGRGKYSINKIWTKIGRKPLFQSEAQPFEHHITAAEMIAEMGEDEFKQYFSFAIVRNPWDWQVSLYKYMRKKYAIKKSREARKKLEPAMGTFDEYIRWRCSEEVRFQKDFIYSKEGELLVDFVGKYENLDKGFETICTRIGVNASLPKLNVSNTKPYQSYYTHETRQLVADTFRADIERFGYEFDIVC